MALHTHPRPAILAFALALLAGGACPALASEASGDDLANEDPATASQEPQSQQKPPPGVSGQAGPPPGVMADSVFDDTWLAVGVGVGLTPSYSGSDDYRVIPLPLVIGRVGGVGITPNGPGLNFDLLSKAPGKGAPKTSVSFGPTFRVRGSRNGGIEDPVVALAGELDTALELGVQGGVSFPGVLNRFDSLTLSAAVRWDVLGAHEGMLVEPSIGYFTPLSRGSAMQVLATASFVDDRFAEYYYSIGPAQSATTGLPQFTADGGLNSLGATAIVTFDLDNNVLNGGLNVFAVGGYSRLVGDSADTPYTSVRGSADQVIGGVGIGYTF